MADPEANHNGGMLPFGPDGLLYIGTGDGGGGGDQHGAAATGRPGSLLGKILRIDPRAAGGRPYRVPSDNPSPARRRAREIYSTGCATRGASRSTAAPATSRSATWARTRSRRSTSCAAARAAAPTSAGARSRAARATEGERARARRPVIERGHAAGCCSITGGYVVRDPALPAWPAATSTATSARAASASARLRPAARATARAHACRVAEPVLVRRGRARARLRASLDGPVYRLAAR